MADNVLILEMSTESGSVALARDGTVLAEIIFTSRDAATGVRSEALAPAVVDCLARASVLAPEVHAVVCGAGPGGFTSLRAAAAFAKGICSALDVPLYAVSSLEILAWSAQVADGNFTVALDAGRGEYFAVDCSSDAVGALAMGATYLASGEDLRGRAIARESTLVGPHLEESVYPRAGAVVSHLADVVSRGASDLDSWEPSYGRLAEAQVKWEAAHGRSLSV